MTSKASGRAALLLAAGIWIGLGAASQAATTTDGSAVATATKHGSHHLRKYAHRKAAKVADKSSDDKKATEASADNSVPVQSAQMPAAVANANAQLPSADTQPVGNIQAMTDRANTIVQGVPANTADARATGAPVVAPDQLNDLDRALQEGTGTTPVALASAEEPAAAPPPVVTASPHSDSSTWDQTSLIGKIFIGFGALLTMASAARMFMA
jgi:hypothetical protein